MEQNMNIYPAKKVIQRAVAQCNKIESSLAGCLRIFQQSSTSNSTDPTDSTSKTSPRELTKKQSYTICKGKKHPDLIEIDDRSDLRDETNTYAMLKYADKKLQNVLASQQNIMHRLTEMRDRLMHTDQRHEDAYELVQQQLAKLNNKT